MKSSADSSSRTHLATSFRKQEIHIAREYGMDAETRAAFERLETLARGGGRVAVAGEFMPDDGVRARLAALGVCENVTEDAFSGFRHIVLPYCGVSPADRRRWSDGDHAVADLCSPHVRRAQVTLGLLRMEGAQTLVIGRHGDPETMALAATSPGSRVIEDTTDTARLEFQPAFGAVCQTTLSPRRAQWLAEQLRLRYRDARVTVLPTAAPAMKAREQALETLLQTAEVAVIVGRAGEASTDALSETALRKGRLPVVVAGPETLDRSVLASAREIAVTAGGFATRAAVRAVCQALA